MLLYSVITILLGNYLAKSELVDPNPSDGNSLATNNPGDSLIFPSETLSSIPGDTIIGTENSLASEIPDVIPGESILPVIPEAPTLLPMTQELVTPAILNELLGSSVEPDSLPLSESEKIVLPESVHAPSQNPEAATIISSTESDPIVTERLSDVPENSNAIKEEIKTDSICQKRNTYYNVAGSCDAYIECREYKSQEQLCPEGLHFNPESKWPEYPCGYPMEVSCQGRGAPQLTIATEDCPHQYGFFSPLVVDPNNCAPYRMCVGGKSIDMQCPFGLAFNPDISRCDWPENVASCNAEDFLGFKCPPHPVNSKGEALDVVINYKNDNDCHKFFSCHAGLARLLSCDLGFVFDADAGRCADSDLVPCHSDQPTKEPTLS